MVYYKVFKYIRKEYGLTHEAFAKKLGYPVDYIHALEAPSNVRKLPTPEFIGVLKEKLNLQDAALTNDERDLLVDDLHRWKDLIDYGELQKAAAHRPELARRTKQSFRPGVQCLYDLYEARYFRIKGDTTAYEKIMASLSKRKQDFTEMCHYLYYRETAITAYVAYRFKESHEAFHAAEQTDKDKSWADMGFYYGYGSCLTYMGYATRAIEYLNKALNKSRWSTDQDGNQNRRYDVHIEGLLAQNYVKVGNAKEALAVLNKRLRYEIKINRTTNLGFVYHDIGRVYHGMKRYDDAIEHYEVSLRYHDVGSIGYLDSLYHKAITLLACNRTDEIVESVDKGLRLSTTEIWEVLFSTLKHSVFLDNLESLRYAEDIAIPMLLKYERNDELINHLEILHEFYEKAGNHDQMAKHARMAFEIQKKLYEERVAMGV